MSYRRTINSGLECDGCQECYSNRIEEVPEDLKLYTEDLEVYNEQANITNEPYFN